MFNRVRFSVTLVLLLVLTLGATSWAKKGGNKPPPQPPADPDISCSPGSGGGPIRIVNDDGSEGYILPTSVNGSSSSWSPDGGSIAFDTGSRLFRVDAAAGWTNEVMLDVDGVEPAWSPNDDWIAYAGDYMTSLELITPDGQTTRTLHAVGPDDWIESPTWNPAGTKIAFLEWPDGGTKMLRVYDVVADTLTTVADLDADRIDWARTKDELVYNIDSSIYTCVLDLDSMTITSTSLIVQDGRWASWSPDDGQVIFSRLKRSIRWELHTYTFSTDAVAPFAPPGRKRPLSGLLADWRR